MHRLGSKKSVLGGTGKQQAMDNQLHHEIGFNNVAGRHSQIRHRLKERKSYLDFRYVAVFRVCQFLFIKIISFNYNCNYFLNQCANCCNQNDKLRDNKIARNENIYIWFLLYLF